MDYTQTKGTINSQINTLI